MDPINTEVKDLINKKFNLIEKKLKNSFQAIKKDMALLKEKTENSELRKDFEFFKEKANSKLKDSENEFNEIKNKISKLNEPVVTKSDIKQINDGFNDSITELRKNLREEVSLMINDAADHKYNKFLDKLKEKDKEIDNLENQISYLKGRITLLMREKKVFGRLYKKQEKQKSKKNSIFSKIVDSLADK